MTDLIPWKKTNNDLTVHRQGNDPFWHMGQDIDRMFGGLLGDWTGGMNVFNGGGGSFMPTVDVKETAKEIRVTAELPGLEEKDIQVSLFGSSLSIKGEKREEHEEEKGDVYRCERQYGSFERVIQLPSEVETDQVKASFKKGVLRIALPKTKEAQSNRRVIPVES